MDAAALERMLRERFGAPDEGLRPEWRCVDRESGTPVLAWVQPREGAPVLFLRHLGSPLDAGMLRFTEVPTEGHLDLVLGSCRREDAPHDEARFHDERRPSR